MMVTHKYGARLYTGLKKLITQHLENRMRENVLCSSDNNFLRTLHVAWNNYKMSLNRIDDFLKYMNRVYVEQNELDDVLNLGLITFRDQVIFKRFLLQNLVRNLEIIKFCCNKIIFYINIDFSMLLIFLNVK